MGNIHQTSDVKDLDSSFRQALLHKLNNSESKDLQPLMGGSSSERLQNMSRLIDEYIKFMRLIQLNPTLRLSPSAIVDQVWHEHILFTKDYREFCNIHFGSYVDHVPTVEGFSEASVSDDQHSYANTLHLYSLHFNSIPSTAYWPVDGKLAKEVSEISTKTLEDIHSFSITTSLTLSVLDCISRDCLLLRPVNGLPLKNNVSTSSYGNTDDNMYVSACGSSCGNTFLSRW